MEIKAVHLRSQDKILSDAENFMRDTGNERWSDVEIYNALNAALDMWNDKVLIPCVYTGISAWTAGTYAYSIPDYVAHSIIRPQMEQVYTVYPELTYADGTALTYTDVNGYYIEPDGEGGYDLRLEIPVGSYDARILYWASNGNIPAVALASQPALNAELAADGTSLVLDSVVTDIGSSGFVKIDDEWIQYAGYSDDGSNTTLNNLVRGLDSTTAAVHSSTTDVFWGVAVDDTALFQQLYDQMRAYLHALFLTDASQQERSNHERQVSFYEQKAMNFWKTYTPSYRRKLKLSGRMMKIL